jgi:hypothetical protein
VLTGFALRERKHRSSKFLEEMPVGRGWLCSSSTQPYRQNIKAYDEYSTLLTTGSGAEGGSQLFKDDEEMERGV